ncbi:MAG: hypothetical protein Q8Q08_10845 [Candidatus Omnitrophota bacterium]|nr:hypothetical protein [Candidatus Omnitrophota bacterium]MDZ4243136.1 hypothetical protein [Candidatus Omnitrophota bacterium]
MSLTFSHIAVILAVCGLLSGCASTKGTAKQDKQLILEEKLRKFSDLSSQLKTQVIPLGTLTAEIRSQFGDPDDVFRSGSQVSSMEIWTYRGISANNDLNFETIQLYFEKDKLITWKY